MNKKTKITLISVGALTVIGGATFGIASLTNSGSTGQKSSSNISSESSSSEKAKGTVTFSDVSEKPKLAATVVSLYGADKLDDSDWSKVGKAVQDHSQDVDLFFSTSKDGGKYKFILENQEPEDDGVWYRLLGNEHEDVVYFDINDSKLQNVPFKKVIEYVNNHYSDSELKEMLERMFVQEEGQPRDHSGKTANSNSNESKHSSVDLRTSYEIDKDMWSRQVMTYLENHVSDLKNPTAFQMIVDIKQGKNNSFNEEPQLKRKYVGKYDGSITHDDLTIGVPQAGGAYVMTIEDSDLVVKFENVGSVETQCIVPISHVEDYLKNYNGTLVNVNLI